LKGNFYLRSKADKQATFFELNKDKTTFTDTSDHKYQVSTTDDHLTLNKLLAYEIGGRTALGTSGETQTKKEKPQLKKESPSFTYDKEKTKENIHQRLSQVNPEVTFDTTLDKDFFTKGFPNYMKGYNLKTELEKAFLLQNDVESDEKLAIHTRKLVLQDGTAIIDIGQNIEWDFDTDNIALNPKERKNPTKITIL
jgi:hypothetical protein